MAEGRRVDEALVLVAAATLAHEVHKAVSDLRGLYERHPELNDLQPSSCPIGELDEATLATLSWYHGWMEKLK